MGASANVVQGTSEELDLEKLRELEASLGTDVEAWMPESGEILSGRVIGLETRASEFGRYPAITVRKADGDELVFHAFRTVAQNELLRIRPMVGDVIAVAYLGIQKGTDYHNYKIKVSREVGSDYDWEQFKPKERPKVVG